MPENDGRTYSLTPVLSKVKMGTVTYYLKDADVRALLNGIDDTVWDALGVGFGTVSATTGVLVDGAAVKNYVDSAVQQLHSFDVQIYDTLPTASADTMYILALVDEEGTASGTYTEYITINNSGSYSWEKVGTTETDLADYVKNTTEIAGVAIGSGITAATLSAALGIKAMGKVAEGITSYAGESITGVKATGDLSGSAALSVSTTTATATVTGAEYTPAGSITGSALSGGSITVTLTDASAASEVAVTTATVDVSNGGTVAITADNSGDFQVAGTNAASAVTFENGATATAVTGVTYTAPVYTAGTFTPNTPTSIDTSKFSGGSAATWTGATYTAGSLAAASSATFAQDGVTATVGTGDDAETLIFAAATTATAVTAQGTYTPGSVNFGTFDGGSAASLAEGFYTAGSAASYTDGSLTDGSVSAATTTVISDIGTATAAAQVFTGNKYSASFTPTAKNITVVTGGTYYKQVVDTAEFSGETATLGFSGTTATITPAVSYDKVTVGDSATVTITGASLDVGTITVSAATMTVLPKVSE